MTSVDHCMPLPDGLRYYDPSGTAFIKEYLDAIVDAVVNSDRSLQQNIGPSEIGDPCSRRIGYKLLGMPSNDKRIPWKATVGTGGHMWAETCFDKYNLRNAQHLDGQERFYIETRVNVGEVAGLPVTGSCDLYDRVTGTVVDHKFPGPTALNRYRQKRDPGQQYRIQAHLYGRGWQRAGLPVSRVMVAFLPRNGELDEAYIWHEPYDEQIAIDALRRLEGIDAAVKMLGPAALELLPTTEAFCTYCPYFRHKSADLTKGCPGDPASKVHETVDPDAPPFGAVAQNTSNTRRGALTS